MTENIVVCIDYQEAKQKMHEIADEFAKKHRTVAASAALVCLNALNALAKTEKAREDQKAREHEAERMCAVEPFLTGGVIGRDVYRCGNCSQVVGKSDRFCRICGRKLRDRQESQTP